MNVKMNRITIDFSASRCCVFTMLYILHYQYGTVNQINGNLETIQFLRNVV